jgi:hypothetical protein
MYHVITTIELWNRNRRNTATRRDDSQFRESFFETTVKEQQEGIDLLVRKEEAFEPLALATRNAICEISTGPL